jgi:hypothetical protein
VVLYDCRRVVDQYSSVLRDQTWIVPPAGNLYFQFV